jgi:hypothetical protein
MVTRTNHGDANIGRVSEGAFRPTHESDGRRIEPRLTRDLSVLRQAGGANESDHHLRPIVPRR